MAENPTVILDSLFLARVRNSLASAVMGVRALSLDFGHPVAELLESIDSAADRDRAGIEAELGKLMRDFWLGTAGLCGSPAYRRVVGELMQYPGFSERWSQLALQPFAASDHPYGAAYLVDRGRQGVYRVLPMRVSLPPDYIVLEYQPYDETAKTALATTRDRLRPFVIENPLRHWSQDPPFNMFLSRRTTSEPDAGDSSGGIRAIRR